MGIKNNLVDEDERTTLRKRPQELLGTKDMRGAFHTVEEIVTNASDEAFNGFGNKIIITFEDDGTGDIITVQDFGRGLPMHWDEEGKKWNWQSALMRLHSSGKYTDNMYKKSAGMYGVGLAASQFTSEFMDVKSVYDGKIYEIHCEKGLATEDVRIRDNTSGVPNGTTIRWKVDREVFPCLYTERFELDKIIEFISEKAMLLDGVTYILKHYKLKQDIVMMYEKGMSSYIDSVLEGNGIIDDTPKFEEEVTATKVNVNPLGVQSVGNEYELTVKCAFNFMQDCSITKAFHNMAPLPNAERSTSVIGFKKGMLRAFNEVAIDNGLLSRSNSKDMFDIKDIEQMLFLIIEGECAGENVDYEGQAKVAVTNVEYLKIFEDFAFTKVSYVLRNCKEKSKILNMAIVNKKAREESSAVKKKVIAELSKEVKFNNMPKQFEDCTSRKTADRELFLVEGLSAKGAVLQSRDCKTQAILPLRGKVDNCMKKRLTEILNSDIIIGIYRVLGCGMEVKSKNIEGLPKFDIDKLKYDKIIIMADADIDGEHITILLLTMFYVLSPSLIKAGKVYIGVTPLYTIRWKEEIRFASNNAELEEKINELLALGASESKIKVERSKGLGENDPDIMNISTMNPATRTLKQVQMNDEDAEVLKKTMEDLMGDSSENRKIIIEQYFRDMLENTETE